MKTDKLFYRIFLSQPDLIAELLPGILPGCEFEYSAPVVKETEVRQMLDLKEVNFSETRFYQDVLQKGLEQGREQGLQREAELVLRLLQRRCGVLSIDRQELVRSLPISQLETLGDALLDFNEMGDLEVWFKVNLSPS